MTGRGEKTPMTDADFAAFLRDETQSRLDATSTADGSGWSGLEVLRLEQGDDCFDCPPLDSHLLVLCTGGGGIAELDYASLVGPRVSVVAPGALCYLPAGDAARFAAAGRYEVVHVLLGRSVVDAALAARCRADPARASFEGFHGRRHLRIAETMIALADPGGCRLSRDRAAIDLAGQLVDYACDMPAPAGEVPDLSALQFTRALDFIEGTLAEDVGLDDIAAHVGVDPLRLARGFEREADCAIDAFRAERRCDVVRDWLSGPGAQVASDTLARAIGFDGTPALDAAFRAHVGIGFEGYRAGRLS